MFLTLLAVYGPPDAPIWPRTASSAAMARRLGGLRVLGARRAGRFASAITLEGAGRRPSHRPVSCRFLSRAALSFATNPAFSNSDTAPRIWLTITGVGDGSVK